MPSSGPRELLAAQGLQQASTGSGQGVAAREAAAHRGGARDDADGGERRNHHGAHRARIAAPAARQR
ncbi:hypothetical protein [Streptomyces sp. NRRL S-340]|uniref:hypothetical protein n=1 Tax=Streptomyces sp. NRRL S-340 TaxID=1463901 RepID=UPI00055BEEDB|nr:hypothetical protein [Streptomyces sp. NRRL S-340]